ncbi:unnamed protein product [Cylindrotheca closterium]|uniref:Uncharacterized protein n=1 Tax=Cylindrotheca closterium TaxID=2856 RepID=A0AAD2CNH6_9STRA|nr:unnamed protein product [Cylindrotheca closterium]
MTAEASSSGDDDADQLNKSSRHSKKERIESDDESMDEGTEKPKKVKKKKKKVTKKDAEAGGEVKKKKKKKKKPAEAVANAEAEAAIDNAEAEVGAEAEAVIVNAAEAQVSPSVSPSSADGDLMPLRMPVRRQSQGNIDLIDGSDAGSEEDVDADDVTAKTSGQGNRRANSTGTYDKQAHVQFLKAQKQKGRAAMSSGSSGSYSDNNNDSDSGSNRDQSPRQPQSRSSGNRPVRTRRDPNQARYKSNSLGALDKKKQQMLLRKKQSIRIPAASRQNMRYMSSDDEDDLSDASNGSDNEGQMALGGDDIPTMPSRDRAPRPARARRPGGQKFRSTSAGVLDKNVRDRFLKKLGDEEDDGGERNNSDGGTSDEGEVEDERPRRPQRVRRGSNQQRFRSTSAGVLDKKKRDVYNAKNSPPTGANFIKPRKRSVGAIKAKETVERSMAESSLHQAQPNIRVALPRLRSYGALNARGSGSTTSRRSSRDRSVVNGSDSDASSDSQEDRMVQSERLLRTDWVDDKGGDDDDDDDDSSSDGSAESEVILVESAALPKSFRPSRKWADASKELDQLPSVTRTSSAQSLPGNSNKKPAEKVLPASASADTSVVTEEEQQDVWMETLNNGGGKMKKKKKKSKKDGMDSSAHKKKTKKKDKPRKSSAPGLESGSYH